jgi:hypothetical protein
VTGTVSTYQHRLDILTHDILVEEGESLPSTLRCRHG